MTYYRPYVSGPIIYMETLGAELRRRGHEVTFLTSHHDAVTPSAPAGIRVQRVPVWGRLSKGVIMPGFLPQAARLLREHDVMLIQVPQLEAPLLAALARATGKPVALTWHCDVQMPSDVVNGIIGAAMHAGAWTAARLAHRIIAYTEDYARNSPVMSRFLEKVEVVPPPVDIPTATPEARIRFRRQHGLEGRRVIGICGRLSAEKGFERLLDALPAVAAEFPEVMVLHAGEAQAVAGEAGYRDALVPRLARETARWKTLGLLNREELAAFFSSCDVTVLPSLNRTESFGLVQVESMLCGTPVVASALAGVRVPVMTTGMGRTVPPGNVEALAAALCEVLGNTAEFRRPRVEIETHYSISVTADGYERLLDRIAARNAVA